MLALLMATNALANTKEFARLDLSLEQDGESLLLQGDIEFNFSKAALEALANGLPLAVETQVDIKPVGNWYWQSSLRSTTYKLEIQYHALSQHYLVKSIGDDYAHAYPTQLSALTALGNVDGLKLIDLSLLESGQEYQVKVRSMLDSESLPVPLRPLIYLSDEWRLSSQWISLDWPRPQ